MLVTCGFPVITLLVDFEVVHSMSRRRCTKPMVETEAFELIRYCVLCEAAVGFQIPIGLKHRCGLAFRPLS
jgi:hypothetical protein